MGAAEPARVSARPRAQRAGRAELARAWLNGLRRSPDGAGRLPAPGTLSRDGQRVFWDVAHPDQTVVIAVTGEPYDELVVEVERPAEVLGLIVGASSGR